MDLATETPRGSFPARHPRRDVRSRGKQQGEDRCKLKSRSTAILLSPISPAVLVMGNVRRQCRRHQELLFLALNEAQISDPHVHSPFYIQLECTCELYWLYTYP